MRHKSHRGISTGFCVLVVLLISSAASAQDLQSFEKRITVKVLPNGLTLVICERHDAPVFSYTTFIDAGDVNDPSGESGLAHMFEHLAFKGTTQIGTTGYAAEKTALAKVEAANDAYEAEYLKPVGRDDAKLKVLNDAFLAAQDEAEKYVIPNQFTEVADANGANNLNAATGLDDTQYSGRCRRTGSNSGHGWSPAAWPMLCRASSTRSATL